MSFRDIKPVPSFIGPNHPHFLRQLHWSYDGEDFTTAIFDVKKLKSGLMGMIKHIAWFTSI